MVARGIDARQVLDVLDDTAIHLCVPEDDAVLRALRLGECVDDGVGEVAPLVVRADIGKVDEVVHGKRETKTAAFPRGALELLARDLQCAHVLAKGVVELHNVDLALRAGNSKHGAMLVPLNAHDGHHRVDENGVFIRLVAHDLHAAVFVANGEAWAARLNVAVGAVVPLHANELLGTNRAFETGRGNLGHEVAGAIVHVELAIDGAKENVLAIGRPLDLGQANVERLAPQAAAVDATDDDGAILVNNADALAIGIPLHVLDHTLVTIVDHLLAPSALVKNPDDDEAVFIRGCELAVVLVPGDDLHRATVALERLVHAEIALRSLGELVAAIELEDLENAALAASAGNPAILAVPGEAGQRNRLGDGNGDLLGEVDEHGGRLQAVFAGITVRPLLQQVFV
eukprot:m.76511 g.76511  ORF g.76511 m.76511 type:complete len:400 (-) comp8114_c0_seq1:98-1297(-)